tara:strand:- start:1636 stop:2691 length:1056 start_codon:yes stop_codon:yes gene_type:complete
MAFKMRSGNTPKFKSMGSSPIKKHTKAHGAPKKTIEDYLNEGFSQIEAEYMARHGAVTGYDTQDKTPPKPKKSTVSKHGQLGDAEIEYKEDLKRHKKRVTDRKKKSPAKKKDKSDLTARVANIITDKANTRAEKGESEYYPFDRASEYSGTKKASPPMEPRMTMNKADRLIKLDKDKANLEKGKKKLAKVSIKSPAKKKISKLKDLRGKTDRGENMPVKTKGLGPRTSFGGVRNPELVPATGKVPQRKVMKDGPKNRVHYHPKQKSPTKHKITNPETGNTSIYHDHSKPKGKSPAKSKRAELDPETKKKMNLVKNYEKYKDLPGFKKHVDKVFGGETKVKGMVSTVKKKKK